jgi:hypothetical protein
MVVLIGSCDPDKYRVGGVADRRRELRLDQKKRPASDQIQFGLVKVMLWHVEAEGNRRETRLSFLDPVISASHPSPSSYLPPSIS